MNGAGNDFIILNDLNSAIPESVFPMLAKVLCERHLSIGADGMMVVVPAVCGGDYGMLFYNTDGSMGEMCGNGARCICRYGYETGLAGATQRVETTAGMVTGYRLDQINYRIRLNDPSVIDLERAIIIDGDVYHVAYVELGDPGIPHVAMQYSGLRNADSNTLYQLGGALRSHPSFPKGANVNFYEIESPGHIFLKTYERGVEDFTYACGTGTGSTALVLCLSGRTGSCVTAEMRGGVLKAEIDFENRKVKNLWLTGPTNIVAKGEITDENLQVIISRRNEQ